MSSSESSDETWVYDLSDNKWYNMTSSNKPSARTSPSIDTIHGTDKVILFGGFDGTIKSDTWIYDYSENSWSKMSPSNFPISRTGHALASNSRLSSIVLFGGRDLTNYFDDTWVYNPYSFYDDGSFISEAYDTKTESSFKSLQWGGIESNNIDIKFQIKTAKTKDGLQLKEYTGPGGSISKYYEYSSTNIWSGHNGDSWIQYKAILSTNLNDLSPILKNVSISFNILPKAILKTPQNSTIITTNNRIFQWTFSDPDSKGQSAFQVVIDDNNTFNDIDFDSGIIVSNNQFWNFPENTEYNKLPNGSWYWKVRIKDDDGDWGSYSVPWKVNIDTKPPTSQIIMPQNNWSYNEMNEIYGNAINPNSDSELSKVEISIFCINEDKYWNGISWIKQETWLLTSGTTTWSYDAGMIFWTSGNQYSINSRAQDNLFNIELLNKENIFVFDIDKPLSIIINLKDKVWINDLNYISGIAEDVGGADIEIVQILIRRDEDNYYWRGSNWGDDEFWLSAFGAKNWSYNTSYVTWTSGNRYSVRSRAIDYAGNIEINNMVHSFTFDDQLPKNLSILINDNYEYTKSKDVVLSLSAEDKTSGITRMAFSINGKNWTNWEPFNKTKSFSLPESDGELSVFFKVQDRADNIGGSTADSIILDTAKPVSLSIIINDGASKTTSKSLTLLLGAMDDLSGVYQMSFSFDRRTWTPWENFSVTKKIDLPSGDGSKIIYFKVKDWAGNEARPVEASIKLESQDFQKSNLSIILSLIIIIVIIILIGIALLIKKKKQRSLLKQSVTIKPDIQLQQKGIPEPYSQPQLYSQQQTSLTQPVFQQPQQTQIPMPMPYQYPQLPPEQQQTIYYQQYKKELKRD